MSANTFIASLWFFYGLVALIYSTFNLADTYHDQRRLRNPLSVTAARGFFIGETIRVLKSLAITVSGLLALTTVPVRSQTTLAGQTILFLLLTLALLIVLGSINARLARKREIQFALEHPEAHP